MLFQYYADADMLHIRLAGSTSTESEEVRPGIVLDLDEHNQVVGIEIEDASRLVDLSRLEVTAVPLTDLVVSERAPALVQ